MNGRRAFISLVGGAVADAAWPAPGEMVRAGRDAMIDRYDVDRSLANFDAAY